MRTYEIKLQSGQHCELRWRHDILAFNSRTQNFLFSKRLGKNKDKPKLGYKMANLNYIKCGTHSSFTPSNLCRHEM